MVRKDKFIVLKNISIQPFWEINNGKTLYKDCHNLAKESFTKRNKISRASIMPGEYKNEVKKWLVTL